MNSLSLPKNNVATLILIFKVFKKFLKYFWNKYKLSDHNFTTKTFFLFCKLRGNKLESMIDKYWRNEYKKITFLHQYGSTFP